MTVSLHFHGAAGTVTGSCYRIVHPKGQFLVDCGMFQGNKTVRALNQKPVPFDVASISEIFGSLAMRDALVARAGGPTAVPRDPSGKSTARC